MPSSFDASFQHHHALLGDVRLHYVMGGQGAPVVLVHGFPQTWFEWRRILPALAERHTVVAVDLRGMGDSSRPEAGYDATTAAEDIHRLVAQLGLGRVALVSHDIGNLVAYAYAATYRAEVSRLVALEAVLPGAGLEQLMAPTPERVLWHFAFHMARDITEALVEGRERLYVSHFLYDYAYNTGAITKEDVDEYVRAFEAPGAKRAAFGYFRSIFQEAARNRVRLERKLEVPVLALGGDHSLGELALPAMQTVAADVRGGAIPRCGHWIPEEQPEALLAQLLPFLEGREPPALAGR